MSIPEWVNGMTMKYRIRNDFIKGAVNVEPIGKQESRLREFGPG